MRGNRVEGRKVIQLSCLEVFLRNEREEFGEISTTSNPSFLILQIGEIWMESRLDKLLTK